MTFYPFFFCGGEGSPTEIDCGTQGTLILTTGGPRQPFVVMSRRVITEAHLEPTPNTMCRVLRQGMVGQPLAINGCTWSLLLTLEKWDHDPNILGKLGGSRPSGSLTVQLFSWLRGWFPFKSLLAGDLKTDSPVRAQ